MVKAITMKELSQLKEPSIIDVREVGEYNEGHIPGAIHLPLSQIQQQYKQLDKEQAYFVVCRSGGRSLKATQFLTRQGYDVTNVEGGMLAYNGPLEN